MVCVGLGCVGVVMFLCCLSMFAYDSMVFRHLAEKEYETRERVAKSLDLLFRQGALFKKADAYRLCDQVGMMDIHKLLYFLQLLDSELFKGCLEAGFLRRLSFAPEGMSAADVGEFGYRRPSQDSRRGSDPDMAFDPETGQPVQLGAVTGTGRRASFMASFPQQKKGDMRPSVDSYDDTKGAIEHESSDFRVSGYLEDMIKAPENQEGGEHAAVDMEEIAFADDNNDDDNKV